MVGPVYTVCPLRVQGLKLTMNTLFSASNNRVHCWHNYLHQFGKRRMTSIPDDFMVTQDKTRCIVANSSHLPDITHSIQSRRIVANSSHLPDITHSIQSTDWVNCPCNS